MSLDEPLSLTSPVFKFELSFPEKEEENVTDVLLTEGGELVEVDSSGIIINRCSLPCSSPLLPHDSSISINVFYMYQPYFKFYLVFIHQVLYIVKKLDPNNLELHKTIYRVLEYFIRDSECSGYASIYIMERGNTSPSVIDLFQSDKSNDKIKQIGNALLKVQSLIQGVNIRLKSAQQVLVDKRISVAKLTGNNLAFEQSFHPLERGIPLIRVLGGSSMKQENVKANPISFGKLWLHVCSDSWIIGIYVSNNLEREIERLELHVVKDNYSVERTALLSTTDQRVDEKIFSSDINKFTSLNANGQGYVVGIMKETVIVSTRLKLPFVLIYQLKGIKDTEQCYLGDLEVSSYQALCISHYPFEKQHDVSDLMSLVMKYDSIDIPYQSSKREMVTVLMNFGFTELSEVYYIRKFGSDSSLKGILLYLHETQELQFMKIFYWKKQQVFWLLESMTRKIAWQIVKRKEMNPAIPLLNELAIWKKYIQSSGRKKGPIEREWMTLLLEHERQTDAIFL